MLSKNGWIMVAAGLVTPALLFLITGTGHAHTGYNDTNNQPPAPSMPTALANLRAFLLMLQHAEGTIGPHAYRTLYGGDLFSSYAYHPNTKVTKWGITSTAAGAYQFLFSTWSDVQQRLSLPDFSPASQDKGAVELIRMKGALPEIAAGNIREAITKCRKVWASLPGAGYGQGERDMDTLLEVFRAHGGTITT